MYWFERIQLGEPVRGIRIRYSGPVPVYGDEAEALQKKAYRKGYDKASDLFNQQIVEHRNEAVYLQETLMHGIQEQFGQAMEEINATLPDLLLSMIRGIWSGLQIDRDTVENIVQEVISDLSPEEEALEIHLSSSDFNLLRERTKDWSDQFPTLKFKENPSLQSGDCVVRSRFGTIDAKVATKIRKIEKELLVE